MSARRRNVLGLWMNGLFVGHWKRPSHVSETLHYAPEWVQHPLGRPLSLSLPFPPADQPISGPAVRAFFENLLPDSQGIRERIAQRYRTPTTVAFDLLAEIGHDCVGALQILPDGMTPRDFPQREATPLSSADIASLLRRSVSRSDILHPYDGDADDFRISLAGAQEKTALLFQNGQWFRPHGSLPTTHILKLPIGLVGNMQLDLRHSIENEWLCAEILREFGLKTAHCAPLQFDDQKVLAVQRFDRRWSHPPGERSHADAAGSADLPMPTSARLLRLPQEDMCQALGVPPHLKYESDGGPGMDRILSLLLHSDNAKQDRLTFFRAQILFWMLCATDGHAKNFSLMLLPQGHYTLAPLYDVMSAYPVLGEGPGKLSPHRARLAMAVRGKQAHWRMRDILRRHWIGLAERHGVIGMNNESAADIIDTLAVRTPTVIEKIRNRLPPGFPHPVADSILQGLQRAANRLLQQH